MKKKRLLAWLMTMVMAIGLLPATALADTPAATLTPNPVEVKENGKKLATLSKTAVDNGNGEYEVTLGVTASENIESQPVEIVFVLDSSGSMAWCTTLEGHTHNNGNCWSCGKIEHKHNMDCFYYDGCPRYEHKHTRDCKLTCTVTEHIHTGGTACDQVTATNPSRMDIVKAKAIDMLKDIQKIGGNVKVGVVDFDSPGYSSQYGAVANCGLTAVNDTTIGTNGTIVKAINKMVASGGTRPDLGLNVADNVFKTAGDPYAKKVVILLADGDADDDNSGTNSGTTAINTAKTMKDKGIEFYTIGFKTNASMLQSIATDAKHYATVENATDLAAIFTKIVQGLAALIIDPMGAEVALDKTNVNVSVTNPTPSSVPGAVIKTDETTKIDRIEWNQQGGLTKAQKVELTYKVTLDETEFLKNADLDAQTDGKFVIDLNGDAKLNYSYQNKGGEMKFPKPQATLEIGQLTEKTVLVDGTTETTYGTPAVTKEIVSANGVSRSKTFTWTLPTDGATIQVDGKTYYYEETKLDGTATTDTTAAATAGKHEVVHRYVAETKAGYAVDYYFENNGTYIKDSTETVQVPDVVVGTEINAIEKHQYTFTGFVYDDVKTKAVNKYKGDVTADGKLTLQLYYSKDTWNPTNPPGEGGSDNFPDNRQVSVVYQAATGGTIQDTTTDEPEKVEGFNLDSTTGTVNLTGATAVANDGYTFTGWTVDNDLDKVSVVKDALKNATLGAMNGVSVVGNTTYTFTANFDKDASSHHVTKTRLTTAPTTGVTWVSGNAPAFDDSEKPVIAKGESVTLLYKVEVKNVKEGGKGTSWNYTITDVGPNAEFVGYTTGKTVTSSNTTDGVAVKGTLTPDETIVLYFTSTFNQSNVTKNEEDENVVRNAVRVDTESTTPVTEETVVDTPNNDLGITKTRVTTAPTANTVKIPTDVTVNYADFVKVDAGSTVTLLYEVTATNTETNTETNTDLSKAKAAGLQYKVKDEDAVYVGYVKETTVGVPKWNGTDGTVDGTLKNGETIKLYFTKTFDISADTTSVSNTAVLSGDGEDTKTETTEITVNKYTYTLKYDKNTTDNTVTNMPDNQTEANTTAVNKDFTVSDAVPTRDGFTFLGWATDKDATTADSNYEAGKKVTLTNATAENGVVEKTLYAVWNPKPVEKVTVSFDLNYADAPEKDVPSAQTINKGTTAKEPTPAPARDGYNFEGWYEKVATGELSANAFDFMNLVNEDVTLYAKWTEIVPEAPEKPETLGVRLLVECTTHGELKDCETGINPLAKEQYTIGDVYQIGTGWAVKVTLNDPDSYVAEDHEKDSEAEQQTTLTFSYVEGKWVANDGDNEFNIYIKATEETKPIDPIEGAKERVSEKIDFATMINWVSGDASDILDELNFDAVPVIEGPEGVTLLYKVTVTNTGETAATYTVTDEDATFVGWEIVDWETTEGEARPAVSKTGETATGTLPGNESIDLYFTKTFVATDVEDGEVVNTAVVNGEDVPDEGTEVVVDGVVVEKEVYKINGKKVAADAKVKDGDTVIYKITVTNKDLKAVENLKVVEKPGKGLQNGAWTDEDGNDLTKSIAELIAEWFAPVAVDDFAADETTADDSVADETATENVATGETTVDDSAADETATENVTTGETTADDSAEDETATENVVTDTTEDAATNEETVDETATDAAEEDVVTNETTAEAITEAANATSKPFVDEDGNVVIPFLNECDEEGDSVVLYYTVTVDTSEGKVANTVIVTDEDDNELAKATTESDVDNSDDEKVPAVKVTKEIKDKAVKRGEWAVYTITVTNAGDVDLENLIVTDFPKDNDVFDINTGKFVDLPKGVTFVDGDDKTVVRIDELEVGKSIELTFKVQVASDAEKNATLENTVVVKNDDVRKEATNDDGYVYKPSSGGSSNHHKKPSKPSKVDEVLNTEDHFQYVQGYPDGTVGPERNITRAEATVIFFRLLQDSVRAEYLTADNEFPDVKLNDWFNLGISTMENGGFVSGYEDGLFRPNGYITRAELATIISNFDDLEPADENKFADVEGHWAEKYINSAAEKGWLSGYEDGLFRPNQYITRAETMSMINRVLNRRVDADGLHADAKQWKDNPENAWYYYAVLEATNYHEYERKDVSDYENWTAIKPEKIWEN